MINHLKKILGFGPSVDMKELIKNGALVLDVRSPGEYKSGHVKGSLNIPLDQLEQNIGKLKDKDRAIITCCASGIRSGSAKGVLRNHGFTNVHNGGSWYNLK
jgi:rhodanese-related sulfurtransferase